MVCCITLVAPAQTPTSDSRLYQIGNPTVTDIWVNPVNGNDGNSGATRAQALRTVQAALSKTPRGVTFTATGYRILLTPGTYTDANFPHYVELRYGTAQLPLIVQAADGRNTVTVTTYWNVYDCKYLYLLDVNIAPDPPEFAIHLERADHVLLRGGKFDGRKVAPQTVKINNSQYVYVEQCDIANSTGTTLDFVATRYGQVIGNRIHDGGNWNMFVKGGSAYFLIEANEFFNAPRGGFSAGQFTGFEYLDAPWVHYEAYDIKFVNNLIHDTTGCGMAVEGGYNILLAHNTLYRTGSENALIELLPGNRICTENTTACAQQQARGGWGTASTSDIHSLPNRNVFVYNNLIYNPAGVQSRWMHILVRGPMTNVAGSNLPSPATLDQNLQVRGNLIWNGPANHPLGIEDSAQGCQPTNPTCNATQLRADNTINAVEPQLANPISGDYLPRSNSNVLTARTFAIPDFSWNDAPGVPSVPTGNLRNALTRDASNVARNATSPPGAYLPARTVLAAAVVSAASYDGAALADESIVTAFGARLATVTQASAQVPLPVTLGGTQVVVRDSVGVERAAPLFFVAPTQVNFQLPANTAYGAATVIITSRDGTISEATVNVAPVAPALFTINANGNGLAAALVLRVRADGSQRYEPIARFDLTQNGFVAVPIEFGAADERLFLVFYGTGFRARTALTNTSVSLGGLSEQVLYAGLSNGLIGVDQVNIPLPRTLIGRGEIAVGLAVDGKTANAVRINVK